MSNKERPFISDKFKKNLRDKATAAVIPLAILLPTGHDLIREKSHNESVKTSFSGTVRSGYENVITTFAPKAPDIQPPANEIISFPKPHPEQQIQVFAGHEMIPAASVVEGIAERKHLPHVPLYSQADWRWGWKRYGTASMADSGCAPTSLAMVISYYEGRYVYPPETAKIALRKGWRVPYVGTSWAAMDNMPEMYGLKSERATWSEAKKALRHGKKVIQAHGEGYFTSSGHIIVLDGINRDGSVRIKDPGPRHRTRATDRQVRGSLGMSWIISEK